MNAIEMLILMKVNQIVAAVQGLPREALAGLLKRAQTANEEAGIGTGGTAAGDLIGANLIASLRLAYQWSNQAHEQLGDRADTIKAALEVLAEGKGGKA